MLGMQTEDTWQKRTEMQADIWRGKGNKEKEENEVFKSCMQKKKKRKERKKKVKRQIQTPL